jgi:tetratricopeptide (TPR) repeat protein
MALVSGRFEILSLAGGGGMGSVFRARDVRTGAVVALKQLHLVDEDTASRFRREGDALCRLEHPGIVRHVASGTDDGGVPFLAMEWIEGGELRARIKTGGRLEPAEVVVLGARLASALAHAHARGIMHRDVKPSNVLLPDDNLAGAVLVDFGLARSDDDHLTRTGVLVGTPTYMAPEQIRDVFISPAVDVFALGCVLYECLAQTTPFAAKGATAVLARVLFDQPVPVERIVPTPARLADLLSAMLKKPYKERPSMQQVAETLAALARAPETAGAARPARRLSGAEQRVVSVIVAGAHAARSASDTLRSEAPTRDLARLHGIAQRFGGDLTALPDGALLTVLSAHGEATDLAVRAADCALALKSVLRETPVALATGRVQTGEGVPIGEAIDRAVAFAPYEGDGVRIDDVTAHLIGSRFETEGSPGGLLLRRRVDRTEAVRTLLGKPTPCVGRDAELATLESVVLQSGDESVTRAVLVTAPAGAGKSRIRKELVARWTARRRAVVWFGRGDSVGAGVPFGVLGQMIRREAGILPGEAPDDTRSKLLARAERAAGPTDAPRIAMFLGEMIGARFEEDDVQLRAARNDPRLMGDQMQRAFVDLVEAECRKRPLVIVLEDLQWGDQPTVDAIDAALRLLEERPLAVLAFARPEVTDVFPRLWEKRGVQPLPLAPLPKRAAARLARAVLGKDASDEVVGALVDKAAGNVFFLEELLRAEAEGRGGEVPATVVAMVHGRLGALEPDARRVLRAASVLGDVFSSAGVRALLGDAGRGADRWLRSLVEGELLTMRAPGPGESDVEYAFRHTLLRDGAYAMLTDADRTLGHRLAAEWLEQAGDAPPLVVAGHYERAGEKARAADAYLRAAEQALESNDLAGAVDRAERGASLGAAGELLGGLRYVQASAHQWRGETESMENAASEAIALLRPEDARWVDAMTMLAVAKQRLGDTADLASVAEDLLGMIDADRGNRSALARAGGRVASLLFFAGKQDQAAEMLDAAERAARDRGADVEARIHQARAPYERQAGRPEAALRHAEAAENAFRMAGDLRNACLMTGVRGFALSELGQYRRAEEVLTRALVTAERLGLTSVAATARSNLGMVLARLGRPAEAEAALRAAIAALESSDRRHEGGSRAYLALVLRDAGALDAAEREARRARVLLEGALALRPLAGAVLGAVLLAAGRAQEALAAVTDAMRWPESGGNIEEGDALLRLTLARAHRATGDAASARAVIAEARNRLLARAHSIDDTDMRRSYVEAVPEHRATLELAEALEA